MQVITKGSSGASVVASWSEISSPSAGDRITAGGISHVHTDEGVTIPTILSDGGSGIHSKVRIWHPDTAGGSDGVGLENFPDAGANSGYTWSQSTASRRPVFDADGGPFSGAAFTLDGTQCWTGASDLLSLGAGRQRFMFGTLVNLSAATNHLFDLYSPTSGGPFFRMTHSANTPAVLWRRDHAHSNLTLSGDHTPPSSTWVPWVFLWDGTGEKTWMIAGGGAGLDSDSLAASLGGTTHAGAADGIGLLCDYTGAGTEPTGLFHSFWAAWDDAATRSAMIALYGSLAAQGGLT